VESAVFDLRLIKKRMTAPTGHIIMAIRKIKLHVFMMSSGTGSTPDICRWPGMAESSSLSDRGISSRGMAFAGPGETATSSASDGFSSKREIPQKG
jgi:hypothetical protein